MNPVGERCPSLPVYRATGMLTPIRTALCSRLRLSSLSCAPDNALRVLETWLLALAIAAFRLFMCV